MHIGPYKHVCVPPPYLSRERTSNCNQQQFQITTTPPLPQLWLLDFSLNESATYPDILFERICHSQWLSHGPLFAVHLLRCARSSRYVAGSSQIQTRSETFLGLCWNQLPWVLARNPINSVEQRALLMKANHKFPQNLGAPATQKLLGPQAFRDIGPDQEQEVPFQLYGLAICRLMLWLLHFQRCLHLKRWTAVTLGSIDEETSIKTPCCWKRSIY